MREQEAWDLDQEEGEGGAMADVDRLAPARGCAWGLVLGTLAWAAILALVAYVLGWPR